VSLKLDFRSGNIASMFKPTLAPDVVGSATPYFNFIFVIPESGMVSRTSTCIQHISDQFIGLASRAPTYWIPDYSSLPRRSPTRRRRVCESIIARATLDVSLPHQSSSQA
jgi:hypothetical protein